MNASQCQPRGMNDNYHVSLFALRGFRASQFPV